MKMSAFTFVIVAVLVGLTSSQKLSLKYVSTEDLNGSSEETGRLQGATKATNCSCGWTNKQRIVGGKETAKNQFPYAASLMIDLVKRVFCGATIITSKHAISAAHCTQPVKDFDLSMVIGAHDLTVDDDIADIVPILKTIEHEAYDPDSYHNDIAIVVLKQSIVFNQHIGPACLPTGPLQLEDEAVKVLGWGKLQWKGESSKVLKQVNLKVFSIETCASRMKRKIHTDRPTQLCTYRRNQDSCQGDSGGPVIWLDPQMNRYALVGIVSYGKVCGSRSPSVSTLITSYLPWIQSQIAENGGETTCAKIE